MVSPSFIIIADRHFHCTRRGGHSRRLSRGKHVPAKLPGSCTTFSFSGAPNVKDILRRHTTRKQKEKDLID